MPVELNIKARFLAKEESYSNCFHFELYQAEMKITLALFALLAVGSVVAKPKSEYPYRSVFFCVSFNHAYPVHAYS